MSGIQIITLLIFLFLSGLFSGIETALMSVNMVKVKALLKQKKRGSEALHRIKQNPHRLIITVLIGNNLVNVAAASLATIVFTDLFGSKGFGAATGIMTFLILVFGEISPKTFALQNAEKISLLVARPVEILSYLLSPIVYVLEGISRFTTRLFGSKEQKEVSEGELRTIVTMGVNEGILNREAARMIHNMLDFEGKKVTEIMTLKPNICMLNGKSKLNDVLDFVVKSNYSRFPVYWSKQDNIIGVLDVDDVLRRVKSKKMNTAVRTISRPAYFVPESKHIDSLLSEFEGRSLPMAIVVDEFGEVSGLVTVEDILEEIVGDIFDKSRKTSVHIKKIDDRITRVDARASVEEINKILHLGIRKHYFDTIAGFIYHKLQRIPNRGERIKLKNVIIEVHRVTKQRVMSVNVIKS